MKYGARWLLPDGVEDVLPPSAESLEQLRRKALDLFSSWGYQLVSPPLVEFVESLYSGSSDLELQTFKITDQVSGRLMGIRADITPQVARIDAHRLPTDLPQRLCYVGPILHARADKIGCSRNPLQVGAELYGHAGIESDAEVISLMVELLQLTALSNVTIELGHMGIFNALVQAAELDSDAAEKLLGALLQKASDEVVNCINDNDVKTATADLIMNLLRLNGGVEIVAEAKRVMARAPQSVVNALDSLDELLGVLCHHFSDVDFHVDLAELRGYRYHTGIIFGAYFPGEGRGIAWGGRYDNIGEQFGRYRAATGFSVDLKNLVHICGVPQPVRAKLYAPSGSEPSLVETIAELRSNGTVVIQALPGQVGGPLDFDCTGELVLDGNEWKAKDLDT
ncbi:MAG TPA: ATP phosphoribosyltransferase regulatory subunit [Gammaproteobacteria bacterium]|nr:ATP phosphoribosyltransferase regulatory subunit [Gammaproteobacteria bacterium]|tara:strand:- start:282 stop:1466 length:1185 start_codon:yes stop_codon:yes gene_type:complete